MSDASTRAAKIRLMIFDVDGILTDGSLHFGADGEALKTFNVLDGQGIRLLQNAGIATAIISARQSPIVARRAADLGITHVRQGIHDKKTAFLQLLNELSIPADECGFIGDDVIDLPVLTRVGFAASVPNGHAEVRQRVHHVTTASGGKGAAREVCDFILRAQNKYDSVLAEYLA
ncbi:MULTISPECIES: HAD family hydrolase [Undibacterium]|jgi:3-deoxy-D-manno-octulosonate 8-phosphate phosphatase (KDO 8-P phosphatase)|uniref:HAD family hydrolase n=1 Tax=Undibacterium rivi TaxID=2828729 RepID=A0ABS5GYH5_9BURK|nr:MULTISPECIES: HAD family hydrolase [Undibacterium]MBC3927138.1 HAD family hydrolase [Undibacterium sp. CY21W]MBK1888972.1 HAD family hydrolase [Undibacterium sp. 14-3-2]MBR7791505.1 HAD family hydrolase [Undibacterium rivi]